jgi:hypothetical protein
MFAQAKSQVKVFHEIKGGLHEVRAGGQGGWV